MDAILGMLKINTLGFVGKSDEAHPRDLRSISGRMASASREPNEPTAHALQSGFLAGRWDKTPGWERS